MAHPYPELEKALSSMLDKIDNAIRGAGYSGSPIRMYLAGGMAVNYYCGSRYTEDVDASFSRRILLPYADLVVDYRRDDGVQSFIYFDQNYNPSLSLMHEDYEQDALEWQGIGNENRLIQLYVLSPVDLAISKISRFTSDDRDDILCLARERLFTADQLRNRAMEALSYYVGDTSWIKTSIEIICKQISEAAPSR